MSVSLDTMHDKCKQVILFHNNLCRFFKALKGVLPEASSLLKPVISHYKQTPRADYILDLTNLLDPHMKYISQYDEGIFTDDYKTGDLVLIPLLDFRKIWNMLNSPDFSPELQASTKKSIFNHLQTLFISASLGLEQIGAFNKNMEKQKAFLMNMIENLKLGDEVKKRVDDIKAKEEADASKGGLAGALGGLGGLGGLAGGLGGLGLGDLLGGAGLGGDMDFSKVTELFGEDNFVMQLAKDIVDELDMGNDEISSPMDSIMSLFANDGKKIQDLIVKVGDKLEKKIASGEVDKDKLLKDAQRMKDKLSSVAPGLSSMINETGINAPLQSHYDALSPEDKEKFSDVPGILAKPFAERTQEEHQRCMSMPGMPTFPMDMPSMPMPGSKKPAPSKSKGKGPSKSKK